MRKLLLIDGHSLIHRAYHAFPRTLATAKGELTNAIYGFTNILLTAINELQPTHAAVAFDLPIVLPALNAKAEFVNPALTKNLSVGPTATFVQTNHLLTISLGSA